MIRIRRLPVKIEAQTVANANLAMASGLTIIPVVNKIDLPGANVDSVLQQLEDVLAIPREEAILASAKADIGIGEILEAIVGRIPPPPAIWKITQTTVPPTGAVDVKFDLV